MHGCSVNEGCLAPGQLLGWFRHEIRPGGRRGLFQAREAKSVLFLLRSALAVFYDVTNDAILISILDTYYDTYTIFPTIFPTWIPLL